MEAVRCRTCNKYTHRNNYVQYFQNVSAEGLRKQVPAFADPFGKQALLALYHACARCSTASRLR